MADRSLDAIYCYDLQTRQFVYLNQTARALYGLANDPKAEVTSASALQRIDPRDRDKVRAAKKASLAARPEQRRCGVPLPARRRNPALAAGPVERHSQRPGRP